MKLLVGLGNPGGEYSRHRHNIGFMALDRIAARHRLPAWRRRFQGETTEGDIDGQRVVLLKPQTYMNESGRSVGEAARFLKIDLADITVLHDELDIEPGRIKYKVGGGNAGHNGLRSISAHLGNEYARVRLGIGHPGHKDAVASYVLHDFAKADMQWLEPLLDAIADHIGRLASGDGARFAADVTRATQPPPAASEGRARPAPVNPPKPATTAKPSGGSRHPAGERMAKRQSALADNLKAWMAKREPKD